MHNTPENVQRFRKLLPYGAQQQIAAELKMSHQAVSKALRRLDPNSKAVQAAVRLISKSDAVETEKKIQELLLASQAVALPQPGASQLAN